MKHGVERPEDRQYSSVHRVIGGRGGNGRVGFHPTVNHHWPETAEAADVPGGFRVGFTPPFGGRGGVGRAMVGWTPTLRLFRLLAEIFQNGRESGSILSSSSMISSRTASAPLALRSIIRSMFLNSK